MKLIPKTTLVFDWYQVIAAFEKHTGMSFNSHGCWGLDYTKVCGEPDFRYHRILQHEQDYMMPYDTHGKEEGDGDLRAILAKSEKSEYNGKQFYCIPFRSVLDYLVFHDILPDDNFIVTNICF